MKKLWGSRFPKGTSALTDRFTSSISYDKRLAHYDILGSIAHVSMLGKQKIISAKEARIIVGGLKGLLSAVDSGKFKFDPKAEDIHSNIQDALARKIGKSAYRLHTARSRNDQIVLDIKMYLKDEIDSLRDFIRNLQSSIVEFAKKNQKIIIPSYTHLQVAQCILFAHHMLAYVEGLERDAQRLYDAKNRIDSMPLGSCALSGTGLDIDRHDVGRMLGFKSVTQNSVDTVSDRDFIVEVLADCAIISIHLSRIAEDMILWSTREFNFIDVDFSFCTGSSIMPHKKNPDVLELIRATVGRVHGDLTNVLVVMKGLPFSYNRDLQMDKPPLFDALDAIKDSLDIFCQIFKNVNLNKDVIASRITDESLFSVDIVEYLIKKGLSQKEAHDAVGSMVRDCLDKGRKISSLSDRELKKFSPKLSGDIRDILNAWASVSMKTSFGGTNPGLVECQLAYWTKKLKV